MKNPILLFFLVVSATLFFGVHFVSATEQITNGGFELGNISGWVSDDGEGLGGNATVETYDVYSGVYSAILTPNSTSNSNTITQTINPALSGGNITIAYKINGISGDYFSISISGGNVYTYSDSGVISGWKTVTIDTNTHLSETTTIIISFYSTTETSNVLIDAVSSEGGDANYGTGKLTNGDFEYGNITGWAIQGNVTVQADEVYEGSFSGEMSANSIEGDSATLVQYIKPTNLENDFLEFIYKFVGDSDEKIIEVTAYDSGGALFSTMDPANEWEIVQSDLSGIGGVYPQIGEPVGVTTEVYDDKTSAVLFDNFKIVHISNLPITIKNGDFELGTFTNWSKVGAFPTLSPTELETYDTYSGTYSASLTHNYTDNYYSGNSISQKIQMSDVGGNLSLAYKRIKNCDIGKFYITAYNPATWKSFNVFEDDWNVQGNDSSWNTLTIDTSPLKYGNYSLYFGTSAYSPGESGILLDNISFSGGTVDKNTNFESGNLNGWGRAYYPYDTNYNQGISIDNTEVYNGSYSANMSAADGNVYLMQLVDAKEYELKNMTFSYKLDDHATNGGYFKVVPNNGTTTDPIWSTTLIDGGAASWQIQTVDLSGYNNTIELQFQLDVQIGGYSTVYVDNISYYYEQKQTPVAKFSATKHSGTYPLTVNFTDLSTNEPTSWNWSFGDGNYSTNQNPSHIYTAPGTYSVALTATNNGGSDTSHRSKYIRVLDIGKPFTNWTLVMDSTQAYINALTTYDDGTGEAIYGGTAEGGRLFKYNATTGGWVQVANQSDSETYILSLTTYDDGTGEAIYGGTRPMGKLLKYNATLGEWLQVANQLSGQQYIYSLTTYDDGTGEAIYGGTGSGGYLYKYNSTTGGWVQVASQLESQSRIHSLTTYDDGTGEAIYGGTYGGGRLFKYNATTGGWVQVASQLESQINILSLTTYDDGTGEAIYGGTGETVYGSAKLFKYNSTLGGWSKVLDTYTSNETSASELNSLIVYNSGSTSGATIYSGVAYGGLLLEAKTSGSETVTFNGTPTNGKIPVVVQFISEASGSPTAWNWSFGDSDSTNSTDQNPIHTYTSLGDFTVTLTVTYTVGSTPTTESITKADYITVGDTPEAGFNGSPLSGYVPHTVTFNDNSLYSPTSWYWNFGDGDPTNDTKQNPVHTYTTAGIYNIALTASNAYGSNTTTKNGYITIFPALPTTTVTPTPTTTATTAIPSVGQITAYLKDKDTSELILKSVNVYLYHTESLSYVSQIITSSGTATFDITSFGNYTLKATSSYYTTNTTTVSATTNATTATLYMNQSPSTSSMGSTAQTVSFLCVDQYGDPISGMNVSAIGVETTLGTLDWVLTLFGINLETTPVTNTTMVGTTGNNGAVVFVFIPTEKYAVTYNSAEKGINETRYYYPSESEYLEVFWIDVPTYSSDIIAFELWNATNTSDSLYMDLGATYNDTTSNTDGYTFWVKNKDKEIIYTYTVTGTLGEKNVSYPVEIKTNDIYYWGFSANNTNYKNPINQSYYIKFRGSQLWVDLGLGYTDTAMIYYNWIAIICIAVTSVLAFNRVTVRFGLATLAIFSIFFKIIGWLATEWLVVAVVATLGFLLYYRFAEQEMGG